MLREKNLSAKDSSWVIHWAKPIRLFYWLSLFSRSSFNFMTPGPPYLMTNGSGFYRMPSQGQRQQEKSMIFSLSCCVSNFLVISSSCLWTLAFSIRRRNTLAGYLVNFHTFLSSFLLINISQAQLLWVDTDWDKKKKSNNFFLIFIIKKRNTNNFKWWGKLENKWPLS